MNPVSSENCSFCTLKLATFKQVLMEVTGFTMFINDVYANIEAFELQGSLSFLHVNLHKFILLYFIFYLIHFLFIDWKFYYRSIDQFL